MSLQVSHVNTYASGGAATAALRLHDALRAIGVNSKFFNGQIDIASRGIYKAPRNTNSFIDRVARRTARTLGQNRWHSLDLTEATRTKPICDMFSDARVDTAVDLDEIQNADIIHLHWIAQFVDLPSLFKRFAGSKCIVWTLHDMNGFTGGCHYSFECSRYNEQCGKCPMLVNSGPNDASARIWQRKERIFGQVAPSDLLIATPSEWLSTEVRRSTLLGRFKVCTVPYGIDTSQYKAVSKESARLALGISREQFSVLFVADNVTNYRKGFDLLAPAMATVSEHIPKLGLISVGNGEVNTSLNARYKVDAMGHISSRQLMALVYSAADILVIPSRQDNLPNTVLESFACGTPAVGFSTGGIPDMIRDSCTGWLATELSASCLASAILRAHQELSFPTTRRQLEMNCREIVEKEYNAELQATRYREIYEQCLQSRAVPPCSGL